MIDKKHLVIDIETLATTNKAFVVSVGWAVAEPTRGIIGTGKFILNRSTQSRRKIDPETVLWWLQQSPEAISASFLQEPNGSPYVLMETLHQVWNSYGCSYAWGFSSMFDLGILEDMARGVGHSYPWNHKNALCLRTLSQLMPHIERPMPKIAHCPRSDAEAQAEYLTKLLMASAGSLQ